MKTIFDPNNREELIDRIKLLNESKSAQWGKMNDYQMVKHCSNWEEWVLGKNQYRYKQEFLGFLFGKMALKRMIDNEKPFDRNIPTLDQFKIKEITGNLKAEKEKWISLLHEYENYSNPGFIHDFFGKMTKDQIGRLAYKHTDHHLRQFNC